jgi:hypothetical protein
MSTPKVLARLSECAPRRETVHPAYVVPADKWIPTVDKQVVEGENYFIAGVSRWPEKGSGTEGMKQVGSTRYATCTLPLKFYSHQDAAAAAEKFCEFLDTFKV